MIKRFQVENSLGEQLSIPIAEPVIMDGPFDNPDPKDGMFITEIEGLGPVKADIKTRDVATKHGSQFVSSRAQSRDISIHFLFFDINGVTAEEARLATYKYFPLGEQVTLRFRTNNRVVRTTGYVESNEPDIFTDQAGATITVNCPSAWFHVSSPKDVQEFEFSNLSNEFEFEFTDEPTPSLIFASINQQKAHEIVSKGEVETGMEIVITALDDAAIKDIVLYNNNTREKMAIDLLQIFPLPSMETDDEIRIKTYTNDKSIYYYRAGVLRNAIQAIDIDTDWLTLRPGTNLFTYTCLGSDGTTNLSDHIKINISAPVLVQGV